mmetsp:Transcript_68345/g.163978  ORF Transcript_68345/g.163978 Transcript_68345/m.163978 type:complete len:563 (+) Transcript_68345:146-1834(+)
MKQTSNKIPGIGPAPMVSHPKRQSWKNQQKELKVMIKEKLAELHLLDADKARVDDCAEVLRSEVSRLGSEWKLELYGSIANGFGTSCSDLDATCIQANAGSRRPRRRDASPSDSDEVAGREDVPAVKVLEQLRDILMENSRFSDITNVIHAKVPILKVRFDDKLDVDLSVNNIQATYNTKLLKAYAELDDRVRDIVLLVKHWAKSAGVCGAQGGHLSSYTWTLMVIYFMQVHQEVGLPYLPPKLDTLSEAVKHAKNMVKTTKPVVELLKLFFQFYAVEYRWGSEVVCIRFGKRMAIGDPLISQMRGQQAARPYIHVEDPYELERNLNCVLGQEQETMLMHAITEAFQRMAYGVGPAGFERPPSVADTSEASPDLGPVSVTSWADAVRQVMKPAQGGEEAGECQSTTDAASELRRGSSLAGDATPEHLPSPWPWAGEVEPMARQSSGEDDISVDLRHSPTLTAAAAGSKVLSLAELESVFHSREGGKVLSLAELESVFHAREGISPEKSPEVFAQKEEYYCEWITRSKKSRRTQIVEAALWTSLLPACKADVDVESPVTILFQ